MWKNKIQTNSTKTSGTKAKPNHQNLQHLCPFAAHSSADTLTSESPDTPLSTRMGSQLPSGIRYIRQTPKSIYQSVPNRSTPSPTTTQSLKISPKNLRFADPLINGKDKDKGNKTDTITKSRPVRATSTERARNRSTSRERSRNNIVRPVITGDDNIDGKKWLQKPVAMSPATRQTSPIFTTVDFGATDKGVTKRTQSSGSNVNTKVKSSVEPKIGKQSSAELKSNKQSSVDSKASKQSSVESTPEASPFEPKTKTMIEIKTPNGTVKRSTVMETNTGTNVHRNTLTFPFESSTQTLNNKSDQNLNQNQNRLSVNVNVAVGLGPNMDNKISSSVNNHFVDQRSEDQMIEDLNQSNQYNNEVDWSPAVAGMGFALKVAVRLRPFIDSEKDSKNDISVIDMNGNTVRIINSDNDNYNRLEFGFDECLNSSDKDLFEYADQDRVFYKMGEPLVERALEGYNVCLFAYGQTGSGKSFTMMGTDTNPGIIPRFVHELYHRFNTKTDVIFSVDVSYCEIYNEKIYDLLSDDKNNNKKTLRIREHPQTGPYVENLTQHSVENYEDIMYRLMSGNKRRATASTVANTDSSRSHSIFTIVLSQLRNSEEMGLDMSCSCGSHINLIDLAGSERVGVTGTSGDRLKEGSLINKSLLNLGKVISKLADLGSHPNKFAHIPYRDSALTWLLRESLGGNSQTSMIATISPAKCYLEETLSTLRYAAIARRIVNYIHINEDPKSRKIRELLEEIALLKQQNVNYNLDLNNKYISDAIGTDVKENIVSKRNETRNSIEPKVIEIKAKKVETLSKSTNTSFVKSKTVSTKGTDTSMSRTKTCSIATNTSFILQKPKTCSTATETSFNIARTDTSTATTYIDLPTRMDLMRTQQLEEQQKKLLEDIKRQRLLLLGEMSNGLSSRLVDKLPDFEDFSESSDKYYECEDVSKNTEDNEWGGGAEEGWSHTIVVSGDTVDKNEEWEKKTDENYYKSEDLVEKLDKMSEEVGWESTPNDAQEAQWGQSSEQIEDNNDWTENADKSSDKQKDSNYWTQEPQKDSEKLEKFNKPKKSKKKNKMSKQKTEEVNNWGTEEIDKIDDKPEETEWGTEDNKTTEETVEESNWGTEDNQNTNEWNTEEASKVEDKAQEEDWGEDTPQKEEESNEWAVDDNNQNDWNSTEEPQKTEEYSDDWKDTNEDNNANNEEFDWGEDDNSSDKTVVHNNDNDNAGGDGDEEW